jgi:hypothetical protein
MITYFFIAPLSEINEQGDLINPMRSLSSLLDRHKKGHCHYKVALPNNIIREKKG